MHLRFVGCRQLLGAARAVRYPHHAAPCSQYTACALCLAPCACMRICMRAAGCTDRYDHAGIAGLLCAAGCLRVAMQAVTTHDCCATYTVTFGIVAQLKNRSTPCTMYTRLAPACASGRDPCHACVRDVLLAVWVAALTLGPGLLRTLQAVIHS